MISRFQFLYLSTRILSDRCDDHDHPEDELYAEHPEVLKSGYGDGPNVCRVKKVDVSSTFIENIYRSGLTLVSSNDIITIKIDKKILKIVKNHKEKKSFKLKIWAVKWKTNSDYEMEKRSFENIHFKKNVWRQLLFLEIVSVTKI